MKNTCEVCEEFFYDEIQKCWVMRVQGNYWNDRLDDYDFIDISVKYCYQCGKKLN